MKTSIKPNYKPRRIIRTLEHVNEALENDAADFPYFRKYNAFIISLTPNIDKEKRENVMKLLEKILGTKVPESLYSYDQVHIYIVYRKINRGNKTVVVPGWGEINDLDYVNSEHNATFPKIFYLNETDTEKKIMDIMMYGSSTPSYEPKKIKRTLENVNEAVGNEAANFPYFKKYNSFIILPDPDDEVRFRNALISFEKVIKIEVPDNLFHGYDEYLACRLDNGILRVRYGHVSQLTRSNLDRNAIFPKLFLPSDTDTVGKIKTIMIYGQLIPSYEPKKIKRTLDVNESVTDYLMNSTYFKKYNSFIIVSTANEDKKEFYDTIEMIGRIFGIEPNMSFFNTRDKDIYFAFRLSNGGSDLSANWSRLDVLDSININFRATYLKLFRANEVNTETKVKSLMIYGQLIPSYEPKKIKREI